MQRATQLELLDRLDDYRLAPDLSANLRDIRRANRYLGGTSALIGQLWPYLAEARTASLLDVATGSADIPIAIGRRAAREGVAVSTIATDLHEPVLTEARRQVAYSGLVGETIRIEQADALALPYADATFDFVTCSLALHHFEPAQAVATLSEMRRVARRAIFVNDLVRCWAGLVGAWLLSQGTTRNPLTRHDAPLSVRRAYREEEILALCRRAGWRSTQFTHARFFRIVVWSEVDAEPHK